MYSREYYRNKKLQDRERFPYGIARSGEFSIQEADFLESKGAFYKALYEGQVEDPNEEDLRMVKVSLGKVKAKSFEEKAWHKYIRYKGREIISLSEATKELADDKDDKADKADKAGKAGKAGKA